MLQRDLGAEERGFLAAVLGVRGVEDAPDRAGQLAPGPQSPRLVQEVAQLRGHVSEAGRGAEDDRVGFGSPTRVPGTNSAPRATSSAIWCVWPYML